ncbi:MAG: amino acid permease [Candidatus Helarchaeota archaeon]|nr:amino acid permease [Candidatus Helarchaeota archaeon]
MKNKGKLIREIGFWTAIAVVISNMIGTGIFTITGFMAADVPDPIWIIGLWVLGGFIALMGALTVAELGAMLPFAGGDYIYIHNGYGPFWAYLTGWMSFFVGFSAPIAASAIAFMEYISFFTPSLSPLQFYNIDIGIISLKVSWGHFFAVLVIFLFAGFHYAGLKASKLVQNSITSLKILFILIVIGASFLWGNGNWQHFNKNFIDNPTSISLTKAGVSLIFVMFAYSGWNAASYIAGEIKNPGKNIPRSLIIGTLVVMLLYLLLNMVYFYALPINEMKGVLRIGSESMNALFGSSVSSFTTVIFAVSILACLSAMVFIGPRVYYAMAEDNLFFKKFKEVHPVFKTPSKAILLQAGWSSVLLISGTFDQLLTYASFILMGFSAMTVSTVYILRKKLPNAERPYKTFGYPISPVIFIIMSIWMMTYTVIERPFESLFGILTILAGIPFYIIFTKRNIKHIMLFYLKKLLTPFVR